MHSLFLGLSLVLLKICLAFLISYVTISFMEYFMHSQIMHKKFLPAWVYRQWSYMQQIFEGHAIRHHGRWYREFDFEPHPEGRHDNIEITPTETVWLFLVASPVWVTLLPFSPLMSATFIVTGLVHISLWNLLHNQMHIPQPAFFMNWSAFRWLARNHYMHHQFTNRNYNIVFPLADYILGTKVEPRTKDMRELLRLGYLQPKSTRAKARLEALCANIATQRSTLATM